MFRVLNKIKIKITDGELQKTITKEIFEPTPTRLPRKAIQTGLQFDAL